jgi:hypothetical protein
MAAPSAPDYRLKQFGGKLRIAWRDVSGATDYNVYLGDTQSTLGIEDAVNYTEAQSNGWFVWWSPTIASALTFVKVTALSALAEESTGTVRQVWVTSDCDAMTGTRPPNR